MVELAKQLVRSDAVQLANGAPPRMALRDVSLA